MSLKRRATDAAFHAVSYTFWIAAGIGIGTIFALAGIGLDQVLWGCK